MSLNLTMPERTELKPRITVIGVGGAGGNAVNNMIGAHLEGVEYVVANTDSQALGLSMTDRTIQLGANLTQGLGAGARPEVGSAAAVEAMDEIMDHIQGSHMVFITAGMGGGTGTGAAPVMAQAARNAGMLTVGVVTKPFHFEGSNRMKIAEAGIKELQNHVDTLIIIPNQNLFRVANEKTTFADAFEMADDVLYSGVRGVTDLMVMPGLINLDFADVRAIMGEMGKAMMGTGEAEGEKRALEAAEAAIANPLLDDVSMKGARAVLINITSGMDTTLYEIDEATNRIRDEVDADANIIFGQTFDEALAGRMRVSIVATGIDADGLSMPAPKLQVVGGADSTARAGLPDTTRAATDMPAMPASMATTPSASTASPMANMPSMSGSFGATSGALALDVSQPELEMPEPEVVQPELMIDPVVEDSVPEQMEATVETQDVLETAVAEELVNDVEPTGIQAETDTPFIARPALTPRASSQTAMQPATKPDAFAEAALTNGAAVESTPKPTRGPSLLERMTGTGRARLKTREAEAQSQAMTQEPSFGRRDQAEPSISAPQVEVKPEPAASEPAKTMATSGMPAIDPSDRLAPAAGDDLLDIPAFLRRQAN
jgi:cell division protein FtsZ